MPQAGLDIRRPRVPGLYDCKPVLRRSVEDSSHAHIKPGNPARGSQRCPYRWISPPSKQRRSCGLTWFTKSYRAGFLGVNGCSRPGRDSQPFGLGLLIGAAISAVLWAAIGVAMFWVGAYV